MNVETQEKLVRMIQRHEGLRLNVYDDENGELIDWKKARELGLIKGVATTGYGRNLEAKDFSNCEANMMLANDIKDCLLTLRLNIPFWDDLSANRQIVLCSMAFQMGFNGLLGFKKMFLAMEYEDWGKAAAEMLDSSWHKRTPKRCEELSELMREG